VRITPLRGWLHEGSHWLMGRLLGERCDVGIYLKSDGRLDYPFACVWQKERHEIPVWKQWFICAAPYLLFGLFMMNRHLGWNVLDYIRFEFE